MSDVIAAITLASTTTVPSNPGCGYHKIWPLGSTEHPHIDVDTRALSAMHCDHPNEEIWSIVNPIIQIKYMYAWCVDHNAHTTLHYIRFTFTFTFTFTFSFSFNFHFHFHLHLHLHHITLHCIALHACICMYIYECIYIYIYTFVCVCVSVCVGICWCLLTFIVWQWRWHNYSECCYGGYRR